jgi:glucokinase
MSKYIAGVDIGGTSVKFGVLTENGELMYQTQAKSVIGDPAKMVELIAKMVEEAPYPISMVGVGTPGTVRLPQNMVSAANLKWKNVSLRNMLSRRLHRPVWVDNDAQTQLAAECWNGASQGLKSVLYLTYGTGVGGALMIDGKPWRGHRNTAGELGHTITHADGLECGCGMRGCYEMYASASALVRMAGGELNAKQIIDRVREGDEAMGRIFDQYLHEVALGIAGYFMVFRPEAIVLGGGISAAGDIFLDGVRQALVQIIPNCADEICDILCLALHRNEAGIRGAAALAKEYCR